MSEKEILNAIICLAKDKNGDKSDTARPYGYLISLLRETELHVDFPSAYPYNQNRSLVAYTFKCDNDDVKEGLDDLSNDLANLCMEYLDIDGNYDLIHDEYGDPEVKIIKVSKVAKLPIEPKVSFERCKDIILKWINSAEKYIFAAIAWFTNSDIMDALKRKSKEGVVIFIIVDAGDNKDTKNKDFLNKYEDLDFPVSFALNMNHNLKNTMHHKFCIIDDKVVLHGTFNWTRKAEYNDEDITEDKNDATINDYFEQFKALRVKYNCFFNFSIKH